ncbi:MULTISPECIES: fimbrillin family protein [Bacteroides]|uniref:fimbrillin family protein n=1 Tax=Bacteroides TaxID=816 RepID=UPI00189B5427|nr:fimbrillin family protein [Bacteroides fragilis]
MTRPFTFLLLWSVALFFGACSGEDSSATDGDRVPLRPGIHAGATLVSSRTLVNGIGTGADRINSIGIYLAVPDGSLYPGSSATGATFTKGSGNSWSSTPPTYVSLRTARLHAWSPATVTLTAGSGTTLSTLPVTLPEGQTFDGANDYGCSVHDYLYGSATSTQGSAEPITANSQNATPAIYLQHALAQLVFRIQNATDRPADAVYDYVKSVHLTAEGGATPFLTGTSGAMALSDGTLSGLSASGKLTFTPSANPQKIGTTGAVTVAYGLVAPKTAAASSARVTLTLRLGEAGLGNTATERELTLTTDVFNQAWNRGNQYIYTLTLGKRGLTLQDAAILPWNAETPVDQDMEPIG